MVCRTIDTTCAEAASGIVWSVSSWAKMVKLPAALNVTVKTPSPATSCAGGGIVALPSDDKMRMTLVTVVTVFQLLSQARTRTVNGNSAVCARGVPVRPVGVPGAGNSPGMRTCSRE